MRGGFADRLRKLRMDRGWSQPELAAQLRVTNGNVGNWEIGPTIPRADQLKKISELFGKEIDWLLHGDPPQFLREVEENHLLDDFMEEVQRLRERIFAVERAAARLRRKPKTLTEAQEIAVETSQEPEVSYDHGANKGKRDRLRELLTDESRDPAPGDQTKPESDRPTGHGVSVEEGT